MIQNPKIAGHVLRLGVDCEWMAEDVREYIEELEKQLAERDAALARCVEALNYLMDRFDNEMWNCPACGHAEETSTMDSAFYLRDWLKTNSLPAASQATAKVQQWQPIETYDKLKRKPKLSVFWFKELKPLWSNGIGLNACASLDRIMGSRTCVLWIPLPEPPTEAIREEKEGE